VRLVVFDENPVSRDGTRHSRCLEDTTLGSRAESLTDPSTKQSDGIRQLGHWRYYLEPRINSMMNNSDLPE
jgi:hypothetical protein